MNELKIFNSNIDQNETSDRTPIEVLLQVGKDERVSARDTYEFLGLNPDNFSRWSKVNIADNQFAETGEDYQETFIEEEVAMPLGRGTKINTKIDYRLSIPFAKKLCMLSRTERGEQARDYFIAVEDTLKHVAQKLPRATPNELIAMLANANIELERQLGEVKAEVKQIGGRLDTALQVFSRPNMDHWRADMDNKIDTLVESQQLSPVAFRGKLYKELEQSGGVFLQSRVNRLKSRMKKQAVTYRERQAVTKLDVISKDKQLRAIFEGIVRKYQAVYLVREKERELPCTAHSQPQ